MFFLSSIKLQYSRTIVLLKKLKLLKKPLFQKRRMVMRFPAKKNAGCPEASRDFPPRKDGILYLPSVCLGTPLPLPQSLCGRTNVRTYGCTDVRTDGHVTNTSQPKFLGLIGYQAPVVQKLDSAIHRINHYPVDRL